MALSDGDVVSLGDSTVMRVALSRPPPPPPPPVPTVESLLRERCEQHCAEIKARRSAAVLRELSRIRESAVQTPELADAAAPQARMETDCRALRAEADEALASLQEARR